jgi:hypothetical protein
MMLTVLPVTFAVPGSGATQPRTFYDEVTPRNYGFVYLTQNGSNAPILPICQPGVQNEYPDNASEGQKIVIITTVTSACVGAGITISQVIVNILPPSSSEILSTAPASPAINTVTTPARIGPWNLIVQVVWNGYPASGNFEIFQTTITIKIN